MKKHLLFFLLMLCTIAELSAQCSINAGPDLSVCASVSPLSINGSRSSGTGLTWSVVGSGSISPNTHTAAIQYTPSAADLSVGIVRLILTLTDTNGICSSLSDTMVINFLTAPQVNAGPDMTVCNNQDSIYFSASITGSYSTSTWAGNGTGTFDNIHNPHTNYALSVADKSSATIPFILSATGTCGNMNDTILIHITSAGSVFAGPDKTACANDSIVFIDGYGTGTKTWSTNGTGIFTNLHTDSTIYFPSTGDKINGTVLLTLTSSASCGTLSDNMIITFAPGATVNAGPNKQLVAGGVALSGTMTGASGVVWTSSGTGTFSPNNSSLNTTYTPSAADNSVGIVTLTLAPTGTGCTATYDQVVLTAHATVCNVTINTTVTGNQVNCRAANNDSVSVGSYFWNYGDGNYGSGKVQDHTYQSAGSYNVAVYYMTPDSLCNATANHLVTIASAPVSVYSVSGTVKAGANHLDKGVVTLFYLNPSGNYIFSQYKTIHPSDNGNYSFSNLVNGNYLVFAMLDSSSSYYLDHSPTYYPNVQLWVNVTPVVVHNTNLSSIDIQLIPFTIVNTTWNKGNDTIVGTITFDASVHLRVASSGPSANPAQYAVATLYDSNNNRLASVYTDPYGNYSFAGIASGNYTVKIEYPGGSSVNTSIPVNVDGNPATKSVANTQVLRENIITGISETSNSVSTSFSIFPNPTQQELSINIPSDMNGNAELKIYNSIGTPILEESIEVQSGNAVRLNIGFATPGLYMLELTNDKKIYKSSFIKN